MFNPTVFWSLSNEKYDHQELVDIKFGKKNRRLCTQKLKIYFFINYIKLEGIFIIFLIANLTDIYWGERERVDHVPLE